MNDEEIKRLFGGNPLPDKYNPLADKSSLEYTESYVEASVIKEENNNRTDPLLESLRQAEHIVGAKKDRILYIAECYIEEMRDNLFCDQFLLHDKYKDVTIDEWNDFLVDRIVSTYISKHKRTLLKNNAESNLSLSGSKNKRDSMLLIKDIEAQENNENLSNIVIMRIPDVYNNENK